MGAWSHESFGNDDACDWAAALAESDGLELIASTLDAVVANGDKYLETPEASRAIAAAEAVARHTSAPSSSARRSSKICVVGLPNRW